MSTQPQPAESSNPMPTWLSIPIILLCLVGGGWLIHWYVISDPLSHDVKVLAEPAKTVSQNPARGMGGLFGNGQGGPRQGGPGGPGGGGPGGGGPGGGGPGGGGQNRNPWNATPMPTPYMRLTSQPRNQWELKTETARVDVSYEKNRLNLRSITYNRISFLPNDVRTTVNAARNIAGNTEQALALKLNVGQTQNLRTLANSVNAMTVSPADRDLLTAELTKYIQASTADRAALDQQLFKTLEEIAQRSVPATIKAANERVEQINKIMTPDLWKQYTSPGAPAAAPK